MKRLQRYSLLALLAAVLTLISPVAFAAPPAGTDASYNDYVRAVEVRLAVQHSAAAKFLAPDVSGGTLTPGSPRIERLAVINLPGALLHHWRATQFVPDAKAADLDHILRNFNAYPALFAPQVERAHAMSPSSDHFHASMRVRQRHVLTVVLDADYDVAFAQLDAQHRYSISRSTGIREINSPDTSTERVLPTDREHGFLWRQNTYWSYEERDGGLFIQVESISLTRAIPSGLGWAIGPYVESIPRDSLEFTLQCVEAALKTRDLSTATTKGKLR